MLILRCLLDILPPFLSCAASTHTVSCVYPCSQCVFVTSPRMHVGVSWTLLPTPPPPPFWRTHHCSPPSPSCAAESRVMNRFLEEGPFWDSNTVSCVYPCSQCVFVTSPRMHVGVSWTPLPPPFWRTHHYSPPSPSCAAESRVMNMCLEDLFWDSNRYWCVGLSVLQCENAALHS